MSHNTWPGLWAAVLPQSLSPSPVLGLLPEGLVHPEITSTGRRLPVAAKEQLPRTRCGRRGSKAPGRSQAPPPPDPGAGADPRPGGGAQAAAQRRARAAQIWARGRTSPRADAGARPGPRTLTRLCRCRPCRPGMRKVGGAATPPRRRPRHCCARPARRPRRAPPSPAPPPGRACPARSPHS